MRSRSPGDDTNDDEYDGRRGPFIRGGRLPLIITRHLSDGCRSVLRCDLAACVLRRVVCLSCGACPLMTELV